MVNPAIQFKRGRDRRDSTCRAGWRNGRGAGFSWAAMVEPRTTQVESGCSAAGTVVEPGCSTLPLLGQWWNCGGTWPPARPLPNGTGDPPGSWWLYFQSFYEVPPSTQKKWPLAIQYAMKAAGRHRPRWTFLSEKVKKNLMRVRGDSNPGWGRTVRDGVHRLQHRDGDVKAQGQRVKRGRRERGAHQLQPAVQACGGGEG